MTRRAQIGRLHAGMTDRFAGRLSTSASPASRLLA
jgi:hypothetical protein